MYMYRTVGVVGCGVFACVPFLTFLCLNIDSLWCLLHVIVPIYDVQYMCNVRSFTQFYIQTRTLYSV